MRGGGLVRPTRREALALAGGGLAWALGGLRLEPAARVDAACGTLVDPDGDGLLARGRGRAAARPDRARRRRARRRPDREPRAATDPHVRDAQSPARVPFLDRLGPRLGGAFRPHETLTVQVLAAAVAAVNDWGEAQAVLVTGDLSTPRSATSSTGR